MSARAIGMADTVPPAFDGGRLGRLTWLGLTISLLGWILLVGAAAFADRFAARMGTIVPPTFHADAIEIARCLIGSGFALAVIGALQTGFGALNRFFAAVLTRSSGRSGPPAAEAPAVTPMPAASRMDRSAEAVLERRPYEILADGSVQVETIVGTRRFDSMDEARDFI